jgi:hypothetical protein
VAFVARATAGADQVEPRVESVMEVVDGQGADPGGRELDGERKPLEGAADVTVLALLPAAAVTSAR